VTATATAPATTSMVPLPYRVTWRHDETPDTVTLALAPVGAGLGRYAPGQFTMVYAFGVGEVPISISGGEDGEDGQVLHTLRAVGAVTAALHAVRPGQVIGLRGPYGTGWGVPAKAGSDLVLVAGGIGLAPLRPVVRHALTHRDRYRRVLVLVGARTPTDLLYPADYPAWRDGGVEVESTVDRAGTGWAGRVGVVPALLDGASLDPARTAAMVCGPEVMMRYTVRGLLRAGVAPAAIEVSLERHMRCGVVQCGHCQLGPLLLCRDGPVVGYPTAAPLWEIREL
jgi:anaerobic sulfite reductase subunit B